MSNKESPFSAYILVSHIAFVVITPLLLFIGGGAWLSNRLNLPDWCIIIFIFLGIFTMIFSLVSYLWKIIKKYGDGDSLSKNAKPEQDPFHRSLKNDPKDYDYYYENRKK
ncbi:MAG: hypothetical protein FWH08_02235 [Oscillospiraceae bacterium]|nr:hypothetical protein [Oscillospiraceae bacterium]